MRGRDQRQIGPFILLAESDTKNDPTGLSTFEISAVDYLGRGLSVDWTAKIKISLLSNKFVSVLCLNFFESISPVVYQQDSYQQRSVLL